MPGKSTKTRMVGMRLSIEAIELIEKALLHQRNNDASLGDYCKNVIERHVRRHGERKYRKAKW